MSTLILFRMGFFEAVFLAMKVLVKLLSVYKAHSNDVEI